LALTLTLATAMHTSQDVMSEDLFLGMAGKTPGSQDCTHMVVKVSFPGAKMADIDLDVTKQQFKAATAKLRLSIYLPLPVDDARG
jgi:dynein assembly factor 6, axonemal